MRMALALHVAAAHGRRHEGTMIRLSLAACVLAAACSDSARGFGGTPGDFGRVETTPECGALSQACIGQGLNAPIARGSTLDLFAEYKVPGSSGPPTKIATANPRVLEATGDTQVTAVGEGMSAILFVGPVGEVIDLVHVFVQTPSELRINRYDAAGDLLGRVQPSSQLLAGDEILIAIEPFANGQPLIGNFTTSFGTTEPAVAQIVPDPVGGWYRVVARGAGRATISFAALGRDTSWQIEVLP
jgi:hypothetical protein